MATSMLHITPGDGEDFPPRTCRPKHWPNDSRREKMVYWFHAAVRKNCVKCVEWFVTKQGLNPNVQSDNMLYTAMDWVQWMSESGKDVKQMHDFLKACGGVTKEDLGTLGLVARPQQPDLPVGDWIDVVPPARCVPPPPDNTNLMNFVAATLPDEELAKTYGVGFTLYQNGSSSSNTPAPMNVD